MVELVEQWLKGFSNVGEIHHPAGFLANRAADVNFYSKRVPVKACTFVPARDIGKPVSGFYLEYSKNIHRRIVPPMTVLRNHFTLSCLETNPGM